MLRPNVRDLLKDLTLANVISEVEIFINENPEKEYYLANIDLLRLYGKNQQRDKFYKLATYLLSCINNSSIYRELARFTYFMERDSVKSKVYARKAIKVNENEPLWVYYIAKIPKTYFEKLYEGIYLTSIPKNASTSLKTMMLEDIHKKKNINPHSIFGNPFFNTNKLDSVVKPEDLTLLSTREPIARFLSYYNKNLIEELSLKEELNYTNKSHEYGVPLSPDLEYFINNLNVYCYLFNDVLHHILPQTAYFESLDIYKVVADVKDSHLLSDAVKQFTNMDGLLEVPRKMISTRPVSDLSLNKKSEMILHNIFEDDLNFYNLGCLSFSKKYSFRF